MGKISLLLFDQNISFPSSLWYIVKIYSPMHFFLLVFTIQSHWLNFSSSKIFEPFNVSEKSRVSSVYLTFIQITISFCLKLIWKLVNFNFQFIFQFSIFSFQLILLKLFDSVFDKQNSKLKIEKLFRVYGLSLTQHKMAL